jgi:hypothetical protein
MSRIKLGDGFIDVLKNMSEQNPGATGVLLEIFREAKIIDPQSAGGGFGPILSLDAEKIYGSHIYILYNDKCDRDIRKLCLLLRAVQLGFFPGSRLRELAADDMREINLSDKEWEEIDKKVCDKLKDFQKDDKKRR